MSKGNKRLVIYIYNTYYIYIYVNDIIFCIEKSEICNFADDNILYASGENIGGVATCLEVDIENVLKWFESNRMVAKP